MSEEKPKKLVKPKQHDVEFIEPPNELKSKAGSGGLPPHIIERGDEFIKNNDIDFIPFAKKHISIIKEALGKIEATDDTLKEKKHIQTIIENIMQIKAHGTMFNCEIMSNISDVALIFLEDATTINEDMINIIKAHNNSIELIIKLNIKDDKSNQGKTIVAELHNATARFTKKYGSLETDTEQL